MNNSLFELRRKIVHIAGGIFFLYLIYFDLYFLPVAMGILVFGFIFSYILRKNYNLRLSKIVSKFEREEEIKNFPIRGFLIFVAGSILSYILFSRYIAFLSIAILSFGDSILSLYGVYFGKVINPLNKEKHLDATFIGIILNSIFLLIFLPFLKSLIISFFSLFFSDLIPVSKIKNNFFRFIFDDNIIIPLTAGIILSYF